MILVEAPDLCQGADEDLLLVMGDIIDPGFLRRHEGENGLWRRVEGTVPDDASRADADARFQTLLGVLRAWRPGAGELVEERRVGAARDDAGRQWIELRAARAYVIVGDADVEEAISGFPLQIVLTGSGEVQTYARKSKAAIDNSGDLRKALRVNGRANRDAADFLLIYEFAERDLTGWPGIRAKLEITRDAQNDFTQSANNLPAMAGGRHVGEQRLTPMTLAQQERFIGDMVQRWITYRARN